MAEKAKGKKTTKKASKIRVPNLRVEDGAEAEAEAEDEGFRAEAAARVKPEAESSSEAGTEEIEVEDFVDGVISVFGQGLGTVVDKSSTIGGGLLSDALSLARSAVSAGVDGIAKVSRVVSDAVGVKGQGSGDKG